MKKPARTLVLAMTAAALLVPATAGASQLRSFSQFDVVTGSIGAPTHTGLILKARAPMTVRAFGGVCPSGGGACVGPDGDPLGLVARVGDGDWTPVGNGPTQVTGTGELVLAVNDSLLTGFTGGFLAITAYDCYPGNGNGDATHYHCGPPGQN
jgi:hypothetical protein